MTIRQFATPAKLRQWFDEHHADTRELLIGFYKKSTGKPSVTYPEALDEALCVGWIDGVRKRVDEPPSRRKAITWWIASGKKEETRLNRLKTLIEAYAERRRLM